MVVPVVCCGGRVDIVEVSACPFGGGDGGESSRGRITDGKYTYDDYSSQPVSSYSFPRQSARRPLGKQVS